MKKFDDKRVVIPNKQVSVKDVFFLFVVMNQP